MDEMLPLDKTAGHIRRMTGCFVIHYSAAVVTQYTATLMFYSKWHVTAVMNPSGNLFFKVVQDLKRRNLTIVCCNCVEK